MSNKKTKNNRIRDFLKKTFGPAKVKFNSVKFQRLRKLQHLLGFL